MRFIRKYRVEVHKKITLPFACLFFLIAGAPVGVYTKKGGSGIAIGFGVLFFVMYWAFLIGGEGLGDRGYIPAWLAMWTPNFVMALIGGLGLYRTTWSSRFRGLGLITKGANWVYGLFKKKR
jgi:lipopolysaccharide export system permease protein